MAGREVYKHLAPLEPEHRFGSRFAVATSMAHPRQTAIAKAQAREYTPCPHLPPLQIR